MLAFGLRGTSGGVVPPVPSTTTSYSGAISSMIAVGYVRMKSWYWGAVVVYWSLSWQDLSRGVAVCNVGVQRAVASLDWPRPILCKWRLRLLDFMHCTSMIHMLFRAMVILAWMNGASASRMNFPFLRRQQREDISHGQGTQLVNVCHDHDYGHMLYRNT